VIRGAVVIGGGGTAGHVLPGIAVARSLVLGGRPAGGVTFVGSSRGQEATLVPEAGFEVVLLPGRGIQRRLTLENVGAAWGIGRAIIRCIALFGRTRPGVVVTLGGYASLAPMVAAVLWRVPIVVTEQNARAGAANRIAGRFARACAVPFEGTDLPRATVTGNPVRPEILAIAEEPGGRARARAELGIEADRRLIAVFSGSLGSRRINSATAELAARWADRAEVVIHQVVGRRDFASAPRPDPAARPEIGLDWRVVEYENRMDLLLVAADVALCRSGGSTVAELSAAGLPSVLVPLPIAPRDHQTANAEALVAVGGAVVIADGELDVDRLEAVMGPLLEAGGPLVEMSAAVRSLARPDAADRVASLVERVAEVGVR